MFVTNLIRSILPSSKASLRKFASADSVKKFTPRRALLYVPGNDERKLEKIPSLDADCVVLDCEDGVAVTSKVNIRPMQTDYLLLNFINFH